MRWRCRHGSVRHLRLGVGRKKTRGTTSPQSETTDGPLKIGGGFNFHDMNKQSYVILSPAIPYKAEYKHTQVKEDTIRTGW